MCMCRALDELAMQAFAGCRVVPCSRTNGSVAAAKLFREVLSAVTIVAGKTRSSSCVRMMVQNEVVCLDKLSDLHLFPMRVQRRSCNLTWLKAENELLYTAKSDCLLHNSHVQDDTYEKAEHTTTDV